MKKTAIAFLAVLLILCGCKKEKLSDEEIYALIRENNTAQKLKERFSSVYVRDQRGSENYSVLDSQDKKVISYYDDSGKVKSVRIDEKDFAYLLNSDGSFSQLVNLEEKEDIWQKIAFLISRMQFEQLSTTDAFYIVKATVPVEDLEGYLEDPSNVSSVDLSLLVDKDSYVVKSFQNETLNLSSKEKKVLPEFNLQYDAKDVLNESEKLLEEHIKGVSEYRKCTVTLDPLNGEETSVQYLVAAGDRSGVLPKEGFRVEDKKSFADNPQLSNDVSYYVTDKEESQEEEEVKHEGKMSEDGVYDDDASGFVSLSEYIPDAILEIRYYSTYNFVGDRIDGYEEPEAFLTKEAAAALKKVSDELVKKGYRLKIYDAYRPQRAVDHFVRWAADLRDSRMKEYFYPEVDKSVLFSEGYIAEKSSHTRGSTVDLTLFDMASGKELDMGSTFDQFAQISHGDYADLTPEQLANRELLKKTMTAYGFEPYAEEWWHFTLADEPYPNTYFNFPVDSGSLKSE